MNSNPAPTMSRRRRIFWWILGAMGAALLILVAGVINTLRLSHEAGDLRRAMLASVSVPVTTHVQLSVGPALLWPARAVLGVIDSVPPEAREICASVRQVSVGVYRLDEQSRSTRERAFATAGDRMRRQGWTRIVAVNDEHTSVAIFTPANEKTLSGRFCLAVWDGEQLVIGSLHAHPQRLTHIVAHLRDRHPL